MIAVLARAGCVYGLRRRCRGLDDAARQDHPDLGGPNTASIDLLDRDLDLGRAKPAGQALQPLHRGARGNQGAQQHVATDTGRRVEDSKTSIRHRLINMAEAQTGGKSPGSRYNQPAPVLNTTILSFSETAPEATSCRTASTAAPPSGEKSTPVSRVASDAVLAKASSVTATAPPALSRSARSIKAPPNGAGTRSPLAMVHGSSQDSQRSAPASNALTTGAQPVLCTVYIRGSSSRTQPA